MKVGMDSVVSVDNLNVATEEEKLKFNFTYSIIKRGPLDTKYKTDISHAIVNKFKFVMGEAL